MLPTAASVLGAHVRCAPAPARRPPLGSLPSRCAFAASSPRRAGARLSSPRRGRGSARPARRCTVESRASRRTPRTDKGSSRPPAGNARAAWWIHPPGAASRNRAPAARAAPRARSGGTRAIRRGAGSRRRLSTPRPGGPARPRRTCSSPTRCGAVREAGRARLQPSLGPTRAGASPASSYRTRAGRPSARCGPRPRRSPVPGVRRSAPARRADRDVMRSSCSCPSSPPAESGGSSHSQRSHARPCVM